MPFLGTLIGTAVAFSAIMLAVSLVIMYLVRLVHYVGNVRGRSLGEMVGALNIGFRLENGDHADAGDDAQSAFVTDILTYPALHAVAKLAVPKPRKGVDPAASIHASRKKAADSVEYIAKDDLIQIICRLSGTRYKIDEKPVGCFPDRWCRNLPPEKRTLAELVEYIDQWFETTEGVSTDQYKKKAKRLTAVLACLVVVAMNLDGLELAAQLYGSGQARDELGQQASDLLDFARRAGAMDANSPLPAARTALVDKLPENLASLASLLDQPHFELGWQHSWIAKALCVADDKCAPDVIEVPASLFGWAVRVGSWLAGLGFSSLLLSLGAPFWARRLENALSLKSAVEEIKADDPSTDAPSPSAKAS